MHLKLKVQFKGSDIYRYSLKVDVLTSVNLPTHFRHANFLIFMLQLTYLQSELSPKFNS